MSALAKSFSAVLLALLFSLAAFSDPLPPDLTYRPLPTLPFSRVKAADEAQKAAVMQRQSDLLNERYDLSGSASTWAGPKSRRSLSIVLERHCRC